MEILKQLHEIVIHAKFGKEREKELRDRETSSKIAASLQNKATFVKSDDKRLAGATPISMMQAFGSKEMNILHDAGITLSEKPSYWEDFERGGYAEKHNIHDIKLKKAEKALGFKLPVLTGKEVYGTDAKPKGPQVKVSSDNTDNLPPMFIIAFSDDTRYLVDSTQANTYIRMWQKIVTA